jgi:Protein of unknown function (DUF1566)
MNSMTMTKHFSQTSVRAFGAAVCASLALLLAACGGGGGGAPDEPRFQSVTVGGVAGIKDNSTGIVWAAELDVDAGVVPTAQELLALADLGEATIAGPFNVVRNRLVQAVEPVVGSASSAWTVDFGAQRLGGLSDEPVDTQAPFAQWRILVRPPGGAGAFNDSADGTAYRNGLVWSICTVGAEYSTLTGMCSGPGTFLSLADAQVAARNARFGGYSDWRLPTKAELQGLLSLGNTQRSLLPPPFADKDSLDTSMPLQYWTSSTSTTPSGLWIVDFSVEQDWGGVELVPTGSRALVRLVRSQR